MSFAPLTWLHGLRAHRWRDAEPVQTHIGTTASGGTRIAARVEEKVVVDAHVDTDVLHDVLVSAGANAFAEAVSVAIGPPKIVASSMTTSADGAFIDREDRIEVVVSITTRERLALFLDAVAGATVDHATLTLTPREEQVEQMEMRS